MFSWLQREGVVSEPEMSRTFNCGLGAVLVVSKQDAQRVVRLLRAQEEAWIVGSLAHKPPGETPRGDEDVRSEREELDFNIVCWIGRSGGRGHQKPGAELTGQSRTLSGHQRPAERSSSRGTRRTQEDQSGRSDLRKRCVCFREL